MVILGGLGSVTLGFGQSIAVAAVFAGSVSRHGYKRLGPPVGIKEQLDKYLGFIYVYSKDLKAARKGIFAVDEIYSKILFDGVSVVEKARREELFNSFTNVDLLLSKLYVPAGITLNSLELLDGKFFGHSDIEPLEISALFLGNTNISSFEEDFSSLELEVIKIENAI